MRHILASLLIVFIISNTTYAKSAFEVMKQVELQSQKVKDQQYSVYMVITDEKGKTRDRYFDILKKISDDYSKSLIKFYKPANVKNTALLNHNKLGETSDPTQWLFLPAFKTVKQISSENKNDSFMGSDFTILDMAGRATEKDNHQIIKENNENYIIKSIPKDSEDNYGMIVYLISKKYYLPLTVEFYNRNMEVIKVLNNYKIEQDNNMYFSNYSVMENKKQSSKTIIEIQQHNFNIDISENDVGIMALK